MHIDLKKYLKLWDKLKKSEAGINILLRIKSLSYFQKKTITENNSIKQERLRQDLENTLQQLLTRLKKARERRPCFLLIGKAGCGKSFFIKHAELSIQQIITQQDNDCQAWLTEEAVYIELPE